MDPQNVDQRSEEERLVISKYLLSLYEDDPEEFMHQVVIEMRLGSITLILRPKSRVCNGSTLAHLS